MVTFRLSVAQKRGQWHHSASGNSLVGMTMCGGFSDTKKPRRCYSYLLEWYWTLSPSAASVALSSMAAEGVQLASM